MEGGGSGNDQELVCKTLQFEHKLFYFDLKENPRGQYLKISEKTSATRSTIIVPASDGILWFLKLFNYFLDASEQEAHSKELKLDAKAFYFDVGENKRGRFLKVSEASVSRNRSTIIVPAGSSGVEGWTAFRNILQEMYEESARLLPVVPNQQQQHMEPGEQQHLPGLSDDVGAGFISGDSTASGAEPNLVDQFIELPQQDEIGGMGPPNFFRVDQKRFYFDLGNNNRGHFLRISEVAGNDRSSIILPLSGLKQFHEMVGHFVEVTKDRVVDGVAAAAAAGAGGPNVRTVDLAQR